jgi:prepilin-type N-terminal cleavage/methylation domain-containing protein
MFKSAISNQQSAISNQQSAISNQQSAISNQRQLGFTLSELLVSLAVLGLIAGLTVPSVVNSVDISRQKAVLKEDIQAISQITQEGYLDGTFESITDWSVLNTTDPIVQYFTSKLGGVVRQCPRGTVAPPCNIRSGTEATSYVDVNHSGRWVMSNGTNITMIGGGHINASYLLFVLNSKPNLNDGVGKQMAVVCNISDSLYSPVTGNGSLKPAQCGPWWLPTRSSIFYSLTWEMLYS